MAWADEPAVAIGAGLADTRAIDDEFADWFGLGGPPSYIADRLGELVDLGVRTFGTAFVGRERERFAAEVMADPSHQIWKSLVERVAATRPASI